MDEYDRRDVMIEPNEFSPEEIAVLAALLDEELQRKHLIQLGAMQMQTTTSANDKIKFVFLEQRIDVDASIDFLNGQTLINAIREAETSEAGMLFPKIADAKRVGHIIAVTLMDDWKINTLKTSGTFKVSGINGGFTTLGQRKHILANNASVKLIQRVW